MRPRRSSRGEVWLVELDPVRGHEQGGQRPVVVVSTDTFNRGPAGLIVVLPLTTTYRAIPLHLRVDPPEGGVRRISYVKCEAIRSISTDRLVERWGVLSDATMATIEDSLRIILEL